jgi:endonuclease/exonuclease/phosphatase family metal-dependent hydrolase
MTRFVSWNMGCGPGSTYRTTHDSAWRYLLDALSPDVALVQEALLSAEDRVRPFGSIVWSKKRPRDSGTGIFVRGGVDFSQVEISIDGSYAAAIRLAVRGVPTEVVSVHVGPESRANLEALRRWLVDHVLPDNPFVVGGDLNSSRSFAPWHSAYLTELSTLGLHDCHWSLHKKESPSFWGRQSAKARYQDDHFFTSHSLGVFARVCTVVDNEDTRRLSDHGPLTLELEEGAG